ncbi:MAG: serine protease, partial [Pirellulaceae bacterium]|nr:serine protease [Pirellulaceae bacterium]
VKVHDLTFNGGPAHFYRLSLKQIASDAALPQYASTHSVSAFSWPPVGLAATAATAETEPNNAHTAAQKITLPCDISGSFYPAADVDMFEFTATKGDVWWVEVASERLGRPTDPAIVVQTASGEGDQRTFNDVVEFSDIASPVKTSSNGYAYDGPPYNGGSSDILGKLEIKQDGVHYLQLSDLFGGTRKDPRNVYRLIIRRAQPDFALVAWGLHMELRNGDRAALSKPIALRGGHTMALEVVTVRRDGFEGPIQLAMEGLPAGVTAQGITIPAGKTRGIMLVTADQNAPTSLSNVNFIGKADIASQTVTRACRLAEMSWPVRDAWGEIPTPRLVSGTPISVSNAELAPLTIAPKEKKVIEVTAGQKATIPLAFMRRTDFSGSVIQLRTFGDTFERTPQFNVPITADAHEATLDTGALKTPPGEYVVAFYGGAVAKYQDNPAAVLSAKSAKQKADEAVTAASAQVDQVMTALAAAASDKKAQLEQDLAAAKTKLTQAQANAKTAADKLTAATERATPKDTVDIVVSEPVTIKVK